MLNRINTVAVVGAGYMGGGIAQSLALAGMQVTLADASEAATQASLERLLTEAAQFEEQGLFVAGATDIIRKNLHTAPSIEAASMMAGGTSARNERIIHTAIGRFIDVYRTMRMTMLSGWWMTFVANR